MTRRSTLLSEVLHDCDVLVRGQRLDDRTGALGKLLSFEPNLATPVHRWYKFKEGFSRGLVEYLLKQYPPASNKSVRFLDPFCGVGTSLLSAESVLQAAGVRRIILRGIE